MQVMTKTSSSTSTRRDHKSTRRSNSSLRRKSRLRRKTRLMMRRKMTRRLLAMEMTIPSTEAISWEIALMLAIALVPVQMFQPLPLKHPVPSHRLLPRGHQAPPLQPLLSPPRPLLVQQWCPRPEPSITSAASLIQPVRTPSARSVGRGPVSRSRGARSTVPRISIWVWSLARSMY